MVFDEAGTYQIEYTATDECGNTTNAERTVIVEAPPTYRTVLYTDGTFIINESSRDEAANVQAHGQPTNVYDPFDPNGNTDVEKYIFSAYSKRTWNSQRSSITSVEIGSNISPTSTAFWFYGMSDCTSIDLDKLDTSSVTDMRSMFYGCSSLTSVDLSGMSTSSVSTFESMFNSCNSLTSLDVSGFDTSSATSLTSMFSNCNSLSSIDVSGFETNDVTNMSFMFYQCNMLPFVDVSNFNTGNTKKMSSMFYGCSLLESLDLSSFNTSIVTNSQEMFRYCTSLKTIYASALFDTSNITTSIQMFDNMSTNLVGGAGTVWSSSNPTDKTYAHIDGGVSDPGYFTAKS